MRVIRWGLGVVLPALLVIGSTGIQASAPGAGIFASDTGNDRIVQMDDMTCAGCTTLGGGHGNGTNQFHGPKGIFVDTVGKIYVTDADNDRVVRVNDLTGTGWTTFGGGTRAASSSSPAKVARPGESTDSMARVAPSETLRERFTCRTVGTTGSCGSMT